MGIRLIFFLFSYFSTKTYVVGTHKKRLDEALLMSTHNIYFCGKIRKISILLEKYALTGAMPFCVVMISNLHSSR